MREIYYQPIGVIHSPFKNVAEIPLLPKSFHGVKGFVELIPKYEDGLQDLAGFSHIILIVDLHLSEKMRLTFRSHLDGKEHGIFASRATNRPNPIGFSVVKLNSVENNRIYIENLDLVDNTPVLDVKPYLPDWDRVAVQSTGWMSDFEKLSEKNRFIK